MSSDVERPFPENLLLKYSPFLVYALVLVILVNELFGLNVLSDIEWLHIVLIAGLLVIPFIREIDHVFIPNVGGVQMSQTMEWKTTMQEVLAETGVESISQPEDSEETTGEDRQSTDEEVEPPTPTKSGRTRSESVQYLEGDVHALGGDVDKIANQIYFLADNNPRLAISRLGMELEHGIRHLIRAKGETPHMHYNQMLKQLHKHSEIDERFLDIAQEIRQARNEVVHSAEYNVEDTAALIDVGIDLLRYINKATETEKIPEADVQTKLSES